MLRVNIRHIEWAIAGELYFRRKDCPEIEDYDKFVKKVMTDFMAIMSSNSDVNMYDHGTSSYWRYQSWSDTIFFTGGSAIRSFFTKLLSVPGFITICKQAKVIRDENTGEFVTMIHLVDPLEMIVNMSSQLEPIAIRGRDADAQWRAEAQDKMKTLHKEEMGPDTEDSDPPEEATSIEYRLTLSQIHNILFSELYCQCKNFPEIEDYIGLTKTICDAFTDEVTHVDREGQFVSGNYSFWAIDTRTRSSFNFTSRPAILMFLSRLKNQPVFTLMAKSGPVAVDLDAIIEHMADTMEVEGRKRWVMCEPNPPASQAKGIAK